jgi:hypothetical protein
LRLVEPVTALAAKPGGLRLEVAGNLLIEPVLELSGQGKDFDGHDFKSFQVSVSPFERPASYRDSGLFVFCHEPPRIWRRAMPAVEDGYSLSR